MRHRHHVTAASLLAACSAAVGIDQQTLPGAGQQLVQTYPGLHAFFDQGKVTTFAGVPMTMGLTPRDAATGWLQAHGEAFGVGPLTVETMWETPVMDGRFTAFGYRQTIAGLPVEFGNVRILVLNEPVPRVVYAAATVAPAPADVAGRPLVSEDIAAQLARAQWSAKGMDTWHKPERIVWQGNGTWTAPVTAWKVTGYAADPAAQLARTYIINCTTGRVEFERNEIYHTDVSGTVRAMATPGTRADSANNPPVPLVVPEVKATITGGGVAYTNRQGQYTITHPGVTPVTVNSGVGSAQGYGGLWVNVVPNDGATPVTASTANVTPPGPGDILLNPTPSERLTSQVNTLICTNLTHNYFKDRAPNFNLLDIAIVANTGVTGTCNAFFSPAAQTINFYNAGGGCNNTAFSSVISHEYGHFIVNRLGLAQNAFGEGYGDTVGILIWDDPIVGMDFRQSAPFYVRDPIGANIQYPCSASCSSAIHCCGQLLGASWWRIRENFGTQYGSQPGLDQTRNLQVAWSLITIGGTSPSAMSGTNGQTTAIEILTVDDNDGNINNGTPNRNLICSALAQGSVLCPALSLLSFSYPNGRPAVLTPDQGNSINVNVAGVSGIPQPGTGTISYRANGGSYTTIAMSQGSPNQYTATIPAQPCGAVIDYYFTAQAQGGGSQTDPGNAPATVYSAIVASSQSVLADLNFNTDPGWTRNLNGAAGLSTGQWDRGVPVSATGQPTADFDGSGQCWVTDNRTGNNDVDGGPTNLTTGIYDLSGFQYATVSFARWFYTINGVLDTFNFQYSTDGTIWNTLDSTGNAPSWQLVSVNLPPAALTATTQFRFTTNDTPNDSVTEAAVDAFKLVGFTCSTASPCYANCDASSGSPVLTANDFQCFLNKFAAGDAYANCDGSTGTPTLTVNDFQCFLNKFAAGCS
ncbi:MAG: hypothetical protein KF678_01250 [Phycisphaeraceae bacterium]|nr:hypothetical protein [Phycisphaeraceae bacterium]